MSHPTNPIVIVGSARTPMGGFQGDFASLTAPQLGGEAIGGALAQSGVDGGDVTEVLMGCVLPAGQGQAPGRQAALAAGLPHSVPCSTVNKMCGSGMLTTMIAYDALHARPEAIFVAGGMESMTNAPYLLPKARGGLRMGHAAVVDHMFLDGLEDAYDKGRLMGTFAEDTAQSYQFTRDDQDRYATASLQRALEATRNGAFAAEIIKVNVPTKTQMLTIAHDEQPLKADLKKIAALKPAFRAGGTVTAANASSISDGAAALVLARAGIAERRGLPVRARIVGTAAVAQAPALFTTAPVAAIRVLLDKIGWTIASVDLFEINEAFAVVPLVAMRDLGLSHDTVNVHGGACALGHPIGASGARIIVTLLGALEKHGVRRGVASVCIGGGEATAIAIERMT
jgi:acetyl-CoA C-acetyltransferase